MIRLSNVKIRANLEDREIIDFALKKYNIVIKRRILWLLKN